jgi:hypothetical protein
MNTMEDLLRLSIAELKTARDNLVREIIPLERKIRDLDHVLAIKRRAIGEDVEFEHAGDELRVRWDS